jgi:predicted site-specific integrase-resolvase
MPVQEKEYMTLKEAADYLNIKRVSLYHYIKSLDLKTEKFKHNKNAYLRTADVKRIKQIKERPWEVK